MQLEIGNCISAEEWLGFTGAHGFVHTMVDRDFCGPHSVDAEQGTYTAHPGQVLEVAWGTDADGTRRRFTANVIDPYLGGADPLPDGYVTGPRALNTMAYVRAGASLSWHREQSRRWASQGGVYDEQISIDLAFDTPLGAPAGPTACNMTAHLVVGVSVTGAAPGSADETFVLPCTYGPAAGSPWIRVVADGFDMSTVNSSWSDYLTSHGIWNKYPSYVSNAFYDSFRPEVFYAPSDDGVLFHDVTMAWYREMLSPPPESVP
jgi:hypothetical protein